ncbi:alpha/beta-hydrolase [Trametes gibbosa]|nr:alpha/beta-hydrolase [Trametes gibbosa]
MILEAGEGFTYAYKHVNGLPVHLDVYPPREVLTTEMQLPAVIYFHGGALTVGNRKSWFPSWLHKRLTNSGMVFISADYQLIPPATGHDILSDIQDLFRFIERSVNQLIEDDWAASNRAGYTLQINARSLAVCGTSAGGLCAYLAAMHASPRPRAVVSLYGMGGDMLTRQYLTLKTEPFFRGREILDVNDFSEYLHPACTRLPPTSDSALAYYPPTHHIPGYPANPRMLLGRLYLQMGTFLDYYTGSHAPSLSATLGALLREVNHDDHSSSGHPSPGPSSGALQTELRGAIPAAHRHLFPQLGVDPALPPMFLIHGSADTAVKVTESENMRSLLQRVGVRAELVIVEGKEHSFDYEPTAEGEFGCPGGLFDRTVIFLQEALFHP